MPTRQFIHEPLQQLGHYSAPSISFADCLLIYCSELERLRGITMAKADHCYRVVEERACIKTHRNEDSRAREKIDLVFDGKRAFIVI